MKRKKKRYHLSESVSDASASISCGVGITRRKRSDDSAEVGGYIFRRLQDNMPHEVAASYIPYEDDVDYDPVTGNPIVRKAKLSLSDYELRYLSFFCKKIEKHGPEVIDQIPELWRRKEKKKTFTWMAKSPTDVDHIFLWTPIKLEAAELLAKGHTPTEVAKRVGREKIEVKSWLRVEAFSMDVARRKLEFTEEHLENRKREFREMLDKIVKRIELSLDRLETNEEKISKRALEELKLLLERATSLRDQERKDHGEATEIVKQTVDIFNEHRYTIGSIIKVINLPAKKERFLRNANVIAEEIAESLALANAKDITPPKDEPKLIGNGEAHDDDEFEED